MDANGHVWAVVRDGGMLTRSDYGGVESVGVKYAESAFGPLRLLYTRREAPWSS